MNCLAESLIACGGFDPVDLRVRFSAWVYFGYCNAFGYNNVPRASVGLGKLFFDHKTLSTSTLLFYLSFRREHFALHQRI